VGGRDLARLLEVRDCTRDFQNAMIAARGEAEAPGSGLQEGSGFGMHSCIGIEPTADCVRVAGDARFLRESSSLCRAGAFDA
jgi:hypothetical protein